MNTFELKILGAEKPFYEGPCESLIVPTTRGMYGVQAHHADMIAALVPGEVKYRVPDGKFHPEMTPDAPTGEMSVAVISGGIIKVEKNEVLMLVDEVMNPDEIDLSRAERAKAEAKEQMLQKKSRMSYYAAQAQLGYAINLLRVKKHHTGIND